MDGYEWQVLNLLRWSGNWDFNFLIVVWRMLCEMVTLSPLLYQDGSSRGGLDNGFTMVFGVKTWYYWYSAPPEMHWCNGADDREFDHQIAWVYETEWWVMGMFLHGDFLIRFLYGWSWFYGHTEIAWFMGCITCPGNPWWYWLASCFGNDGFIKSAACREYILWITNVVSVTGQCPSWGCYNGVHSGNWCRHWCSTMTLLAIGLVVLANVCERHWPLHIMGVITIVFNSGNWCVHWCSAMIQMAIGF